MSEPEIKVHFAPAIAAKLANDEFVGWADAIRRWHYEGDPDFGDPDRVFGCIAYNSANGYSPTWARHMHIAPSDAQALERWDRTPRAYLRQSDRLLVLSMNEENPVKYGVLLLALLGDPGGHDLLIKGAAAQERRETWEGLAEAHQVKGTVPEGTVTGI